MSGVFITGTDTDCGKTAISLGLMAALQSRGLHVLGMKPVASGCALEPSGLRNADALRLLEQGSSREHYDWINPYAFGPPIAPHLAAAEAGIEISLTRIVTAYLALEARADWVVVEGVGGWRVPLGPDLSLSDLPSALELPVILVVGLRLGCINHALLTAESIQISDARLIGWIGILPKIEPVDWDAKGSWP
jgi:dethiobiotin synthetase